ncbi:lysozyme inhibitor LprI family protein [Shimia abyssi]|uniref:Uncharacterized protein YecT (DUF1311 family) n=1 Tax=Shimia abyssi TaxID=1662395 RepID=A0A2P8FJH9_9RHOB|nr:lysozyme inhibitor LprI family protein [Shimia abyssi]PSL21872.1 uncharacterized protein YecT (DUF1311 family) [Shimia abyssi]
MMRGVTLLVCLSASALAAQELVFSPAATEACMVEFGHLVDVSFCAGESANACMEATTDGSTTVGMSGCLEQERVYWDGRLNAAYGVVQSGARKIDAEMRELGSSAPSQADALRDMQRAWIGYRDATCDYERALWGGGTGGGPATVSCHMSLTAKQALYLEAAQEN